LIAIFAGLAAALFWTVATLLSSRSGRMIGAPSTLAWVMVVGLAIAAPLALLDAPPSLTPSLVALLLLSGVGNAVGLLLAYAALRLGKVGIVAAIISSEGAVAAAIAVVAGEAVSPPVGVVLGVIAVGIVIAARRGDESPAGTVAAPGRAAWLAIGGAFALGTGLYATGKVGTEAPLIWVLLSARVIGTLLVFMPLALSARLRLTRAVLPLVVAGGCCEVAGLASFTIAARHNLAIASVLASQVGALASVSAYLLFGERIGRLQIAGIATIVIGLVALSILQI
jgi:drug/metabolite transporter (DMT)-like permease